MSWQDDLKILLEQQSTTNTNKSYSNNSVDNTSKKTISSGIKTQFDTVSSSNYRKQLIIGLDFGTAFTKAVVSEVRLRFAIPLNGTGKDINEYLLPSTFWINEKEICSIEDQTGRQNTDLKIGLIENHLNEESLIKVATYLALVLRRIRAFIFNQKKDLYGNNYIDWMINAGLPTDNYHNDTLINSYKKIISSSWIASARPENITLSLVKKILQKHEQFNQSEGFSLHSDSINVFPEFVAQVTGYVRSPRRQPDLHLLIDVGAGTLDATVFNVHEADDEDRFPIFAKAVKSMGTRYLVKHRLKGCSIGETGELDPLSPIPKKLRFAEILKITEQDLNFKDKPFRAVTLKTIKSMLTYTKRRRYPRSPRWRDGVPLFLCGGGSNCDFYRDVFLSQGEMRGIPITEVQLPKPDSLEAEGIGMDYDRISVAYGLSFDPFDIGQIIRADEINDIVRNPGGRNHTNSNQINTFCPRCNGSGGLHTTCNKCGGTGWI